MNPILPNEHRAIQMLKVASQYIRTHAPDNTILYDEAKCDGYCVAEDCENAIYELEMLLRENRDLKMEIAMHREFQKNINQALSGDSEAFNSNS